MTDLGMGDGIIFTPLNFSDLWSPFCLVHRPTVLILLLEGWSHVLDPWTRQLGYMQGSGKDHGHWQSGSLVGFAGNTRSIITLRFRPERWLFAWMSFIYFHRTKLLLPKITTCTRDTVNCSSVKIITRSASLSSIGQKGCPLHTVNMTDRGRHHSTMTHNFYHYKYLRIIVTRRSN